MNIEINNYQPHKKLWCRIGAVTFPNNYTVMLHLAEGNCTDMSGAIAYAKKVASGLGDFDLRVIHTVAACGKATIYALSDSGEWFARTGC